MTTNPSVIHHVTAHLMFALSRQPALAKTTMAHLTVTSFKPLIQGSRSAAVLLISLRPLADHRSLGNGPTRSKITVLIRTDVRSYTGRLHGRSLHPKRSQRNTRLVFKTAVAIVLMLGVRFRARSQSGGLYSCNELSRSEKMSASGRVRHRRRQPVDENCPGASFIMTTPS